jgi:hypothetical protein
LAVMPRAVMLICSGGDASGWWYPLIIAPAVLSKLRTFRWRNVSPCCEGGGILTRGILHVGLINLFKHGSRGDFMLDGWCPFMAEAMVGGYATSAGAQILAGMPFGGGCHELGCSLFYLLDLVCSHFEWFGLIFNLGLTAHKRASLLDVCATPCGRVCLEYAMWLTLR